MTHQVRRLLRGGYLALARRAARAYVAGPELGDALRVCRWLSRHGYANTICFWNVGEDSPRQVADAYLAAVGALKQEPFDSYLSIKAPPLKFDPHLLAEILERIGPAALRIHFDSLGPDAADQTFSLIAAAAPGYGNLGCTLPGRWDRSLRDADWAVDLGLSVRVVKGQWADPDQPDMDLCAGFLAVIDRLARHARHVAVATHDAPLAYEALRRLRAAQTSCELELLYGLPVHHVIRVAARAGVPVRFYVPYGHAWLPYCLSQAQQNPRILWWVFQDALLGRSFRLPKVSWERTNL